MDTSKLIGGGDVLLQVSPPIEKYHNFNIMLIESLADFFDVDPTVTPLNISKYVNEHAINLLFSPSAPESHNISIQFEFGDYTIHCDSSVSISILGDQEAHENGEMTLPHSMHVNSGIEDRGCDACNATSD